MLQRLTEDLEYHELLDKAARCENSLEQMCLVAAFSVSSYSTTVHRTAKPFNPLLGETYELDRLEEFGYRSLCEQVSVKSQKVYGNIWGSYPLAFIFTSVEVVKLEQGTPQFFFSVMVKLNFQHPLLQSSYHMILQQSF